MLLRSAYENGITFFYTAQPYGNNEELVGEALRVGNYKIALMEIPFLALTLIMIWLKYPFKN